MEEQGSYVTNGDRLAMQELASFFKPGQLGKFVDLLKEAQDDGYSVVKVVMTDHRVESFRIERIVK